jgi:hypothetical protein
VGLSPALQGGGKVPQVVVVGVGVERDGGPPGRTSTARMTLWLPDLEVGVASRPDLAGGCGGGGGSFGRHGVAGRRVASCGGMVGGRPLPPSPFTSVVSLVSGGLLGGAMCRVSDVVDGQRPALEVSLAGCGATCRRRPLAEGAWVCSRGRSSE